MIKAELNGTPKQFQNELQKSELARILRAKHGLVCIFHGGDLIPLPHPEATCAKFIKSLVAAQ